jgi:hypothetical protein
MIKINHTINLVAEIDEHKAPDYVITALATMPESFIQKLFSETFINSVDSLNTMEKINENNSYAQLKWGNN